MGKDVQQVLPLDKVQYSRRCLALESLTVDKTGLTAGQLKKVRYFLRRIFKWRRSGFDGRICCIQGPKKRSGQNSLSDEFECSPSTIRNWLKWAKSAKLIDVRIDCNHFGDRQTWIFFRWPHILSLGESKPTNIVDQTATVDDQKVTDEDQTATDNISHIYQEQSMTTTAALVGADRVMEEINALLVTVPKFNRPTLVARELAFNGVEVDEVREAVIQYLENIRIDPDLMGPGALVDRLRSGSWPVDVLSIDQINKKRSANKAAVRKRHYEQKLWPSIKEMRKNSVSEDAIEVAVKEILPEDLWYLYFGESSG